MAGFACRAGLSAVPLAARSGATESQIELKALMRKPDSVVTLAPRRTWAEDGGKRQDLTPSPVKKQPGGCFGVWGRRIGVGAKDKT